MRKKQSKRKRWLWLLFLPLFGLFLFSGYKLWNMHTDYQKGDQVQQELLVYKPSSSIPNDTQIPISSDETLPPQIIENTGLIELQNKYPDVRGWLTVDGTNIDYAFAQGKNNDTYLRHTLDGKDLVSGTIFMDYRCPADLDGYTILFGHHMKNGSMFADLLKFADTDFFETHMTGAVYLPYASYPIEMIAYLVIDRSDSVVYNPEADHEKILSYVETHARQYRQVVLEENDTLITLSTCNYEFDNARSVLIARVIRR